MEIMRLMYIKIEQIEYFIWLSRVQRVAKDNHDNNAMLLGKEFINLCN